MGASFPLVSTFPFSLPGFKITISNHLKNGLGYVYFSICTRSFFTRWWHDYLDQLAIAAVGKECAALKIGVFEAPLQILGHSSTQQTQHLTGTAPGHSVPTAAMAIVVEDIGGRFPL